MLDTGLLDPSAESELNSSEPLAESDDDLSSKYDAFSPPTSSAFGIKDSAFT